MTENRGITGIYGILPADIALDELLQKAESALAGGVRTLQLRDKKQGYKRGLKRALKLRDLCHSYKARLFINDSSRLAMDSNANGVHLGRDDIQNLTRMRAEIVSGKEHKLIIGVSCKGDAGFARHVLNDGADYVSFGAVFPTTSKTDATAIGLHRLAKARQLFPQANICAIGGITLETLPAIKKAGADCVAVISALFSAPDIEAQAKKMVEIWNNAPSV